MNQDIPKETYIGIVEFTIDAMTKLAKEEPAYDLALDLSYYYDRTIKKEGVLTKEEFLNICKKMGVTIKTN